MIRTLTAALAALLPLAAADFWHEKKFHEWNEKQVRRVLEDSPWARPVALSVGTGRSRTGGSGDMADAAAPSRRSRGGGNVRPPEAPPAITAVVRWHTAMPIKQAVAVARFGPEAATSPEAAKMLQTEEQRYVVGFIGIPAQAVRGAQPDSFKERLEIRLKNKPVLSPENVRVDRQQGRVNIYGFFSRGRNGSPLIEVSDGEVEVVLKLQDMKVTRKFKLKEMMYRGKLEI